MWDLVSFWSCLGREDSEFDMPMKENWVEEKYMKSIERERERERELLRTEMGGCYRDPT
ncbi:hypothetical protein LguiA_032194 [Lonicera macranthoides]